MQLATEKDGQPYVCSVYFVHDEKFNLYWASWPERRHSQRILNNSKVGAAIAVNTNKNEKVSGIQVIGAVSLCESKEEILPIARLYAEKFDMPQEWVEKFSLLKTRHRLYKLTPSVVELFDEDKFPDNPQQKIIG